MIFSELYGTLLDTELGSQDRTQLFTTARRKQAVNDAQKAFVRQTGCTKVYGEIPLADEVAEYNIFAFLTNYIRLSGDPSIRWLENGTTTRYLQGDRDFPRRSPEQLDRLETGWRAAPAATPSAWYLRKHEGALYLGAYPAPSIRPGDTMDWIVPYVARPDVMSSDAHEPFTVGGQTLDDLEPYHQALVHYAASMLEPLRKNTSGRQVQMQMYTGYVAQFLQQEQQDGQNQITLVRDYLADGLRSSRAGDPRR